MTEPFATNHRYRIFAADGMILWLPAFEPAMHAALDGPDEARPVDYDDARDGEWADAEERRLNR